MKPKPLIILVISLFLLLGGGAGVFFLVSQPQAPNSAETGEMREVGNSGSRTGLQSPDTTTPARQFELPPETNLYTLKAALNRSEVEVSGNAEPVSVKECSFAQAGTLESLQVSRDKTITKGSLIARLNTDDLDYQIAELEYQIEQEALSGSPRKLQLLRTQLGLLQKQRGNFVLYADFNGLVTETAADVGDGVDKSTIIARVISHRQLMARVSIDELDVPRLKPGQEAEVYFDALDQTPVYGTIQRIAPEGTVTGNGYTVVEVELVFSEVPEHILSGYSFSGSIFTSGEKSTLTIDKRAVQAISDSQGILYQVSSLNPLTVTPVPVQIGSYSMLEYEILDSQLMEGTQIAASAAAVEAMSQNREGQGAGFGIPGLRMPGARRGETGEPGAEPGRPPSGVTPVGVEPGAGGQAPGSSQAPAGRY